MASTAAHYLWTPLTPSMPVCPVIQEQIDSLPITPPDSGEPFVDGSTKVDGRSIEKALHVLATERDALSHMERVYATTSSAQVSLTTAISHIIRSQSQHGKVVFTGVGKSGLVARKLVATFNSLSIHSTFLHPIEALHGDLGLVRPQDVVIMITFSGRTPELNSLLPHIPAHVPILIMTNHFNPESCPLLNNAYRASSSDVLLPTPIHESEITSFGLSAPTTSTTVTMALGDSLALAVAERMHGAVGKTSAQVFATNHPGGAIGAAVAGAMPASPRVLDIAIKVAEVPLVSHPSDRTLRCLDVLLTAVRSNKGWVRTSPTHIIAPRRCQALTNPKALVSDTRDEHGCSIVIEQTDWISIPGDCTVEECKQWIIKMREEGSGRGKEFLRPGTILGIVDKQSQKSGVVEIEDIVGEDFCREF